MKWRHKALLQNVFALIPNPLGPFLYYQMQRRMGGLRKPDPVSRLQAGKHLAGLLRRQGRDISGSRVVEIGTGHQINLPVALWLLGAEEIITLDLNRYLKHELVSADLCWITGHHHEVHELLELSSTNRLTELTALVNTGMAVSEILNRLNIRYFAPSNATNIPLADKSIDFHVSYAVLEHIPPHVIEALILEGLRILKPNGFFVHCIDFSDHFSHDDRSISSINFLRFSEMEWGRLAGNRYMFHNRLRLPEFLALLDRLDLAPCYVEPSIDSVALTLLQEGYPLDERFRGIAAEDLAVGHAWILADGASFTQGSSSQRHTNRRAQPAVS